MRYLPETTLEVNEPSVISETIDGETIIINLDSGTYYSLKGAGAIIWAAIQQSVSLAAISAIIRSSYDVDGHHVEDEISGLVQGLVKENLVRPTLGDISPHAAACASSPKERLGPFLAPVLDKFTDMEAMLLLDPVHDVDERGWPNLPKWGDRLDA